MLLLFFIVLLSCVFILCSSSTMRLLLAMGALLLSSVFLNFLSIQTWLLLSLALVFLTALMPLWVLLFFTLKSYSYKTPSFFHRISSFSFFLGSLILSINLVSPLDYNLSATTLFTSTSTTFSTFMLFLISFLLGFFTLLSYSYPDLGPIRSL